MWCVCRSLKVQIIDLQIDKKVTISFDSRDYQIYIAVSNYQIYACFYLVTN